VKLWILKCFIITEIFAKKEMIFKKIYQFMLKDFEIFGVCTCS